MLPHNDHNLFFLFVQFSDATFRIVFVGLHEMMQNVDSSDTFEKSCVHKFYI